MKTKRIILWALIGLFGALVLPPAAVFARQMLQMATAADQRAAEAIAATELRSLLDARRGFARSPNTISHPFEFPYLDCPQKEGGRIPPSIDETLTFVFIGDASFRDEVATRAALIERFSRAQIAILTACMEATPFAARCQTIADEATGHVRRSDDPRFSDRNRAVAYCAAMTAIGRTGETK